jgi:hypothetical protein
MRRRMPPVTAAMPTSGGIGKVCSFSAVTWMGPRSMAFSVVV